jgi:P27 family predicted phage terminase small subunit
MRGRKPLPSNVVRLRGNPGKRRLSKREPRPPAGMPDCPEHLNAEAKRAWKMIAPRLHALGLLTELDGDALAVYCACWSRWVAAERRLEAEGMLVPSRGGSMKPNPYIAIANQALRQMLSMAIEFGMTPSSRRRVEVDPPEAPDPFDDLLNS